MPDLLEPHNPRRLVLATLLSRIRVLHVQDLDERAMTQAGVFGRPSERSQDLQAPEDDRIVTLASKWAVNHCQECS